MKGGASVHACESFRARRGGVKVGNGRSRLLLTTRKPSLTNFSPLWHCLASFGSIAIVSGQSAPLASGRGWTLRESTLAKIVYWPGDLAIPFRGVTGEVTTYSTRDAVTGSMPYVCGKGPRGTSGTARRGRAPTPLLWQITSMPLFFLALRWGLSRG